LCAIITFAFLLLSILQNLAIFNPVINSQYMLLYLDNGDVKFMNLCVECTTLK